MSRTIDERARAYAIGEVSMFRRKVHVYVRKLFDLPASPGAEDLNQVHDAFARELEGMVASAFVIGHGAGIEDQERPRWRR